jgi:hypothetical protein
VLESCRQVAANHVPDAAVTLNEVVDVVTSAVSGLPSGRFFQLVHPHYDGCVVLTMLVPMHCANDTKSAKGSGQRHFNGLVDVSFTVFSTLVFMIQ